MLKRRKLSRELLKKKRVKKYYFYKIRVLMSNLGMVKIRKEKERKEVQK